MAISSEFTDHLLELLEPVGGIEVRRMFGGAGLFHTNLMFALVARDVVYLKVDDANRPAFEARGMEPFTYGTKNGERTISGLYEIPEELLEDSETFCAWAKDAIEVAWRADARKPPSRRKRMG